MPRDSSLYLTDILSCIGKVREYTQDMSFESFRQDGKTQDAVIRNLEIIGEAARNLPVEFRERTACVGWPDVIGFRNVIVHEYFGVDIQIVWDIAQHELDMLEKACRSLL